MARAVISNCIRLILILVAVSAWTSMPRTAASAPTTRITPKILTVAMEQDGNPQTTNTGEASAWVQNDQLNHKIDIVGGNGPVYCNAAYDHCLVITGVGVINASVTIMALGLSDKFDLSKTYIMVAGIAGTPPRDGNHRLCCVVRVCRLRWPRQWYRSPRTRL